MQIPFEKWHNLCALHLRKEHPLEPRNGSITVWLPSALLSRTGGRSRVSVQAGTVREAIDALECNYPGLRFNICYETGELRRFVNVFLDGESVRYLDGLDTPTSPGATIHVIHSVAGG